MRVFLLIFSAILLMGGETSPHRVVSTSLCGDGFVISMTAPENILALSWQSDDNLSNAPQSLRGIPKAWDDPERLLTLKPDLVVFGAGEGRVAKPILGKAGISYINIKWGEDFASIENNKANLAKALHINMSKKREVKHFPKRLIKILYLSSSGATAGPNTYIDEAITKAGGVNIISKSGWHTPDPENLVDLKPDLIITSFFKESYASVNEAGLRNTVLHNKIKNTPHINIPGKLWPCAGPGLFEATHLIADAISELPR